MKVEVVTGGVAYDLGDNVNLRFLKQGGWGLAPLHRLTQQGPMQHGATDIGFRLDPRKLLVNLVALATQKQDTWPRRDLLLNIFKPGDTPLTLRVTRDDLTQRQIDCFVNGGLAFDSSTRKGYHQFEAVELMAPDPCWYNPIISQFKLGLTVGGGTFTVPMPVPTGVGVSTLDYTQSIAYGGSWHDYPRIVIVGPIANLVIANLTLNVKLDFAGYTIAAGDTVTIDLRYGYKTVVNQSDANLIQYLTNDSDLSSWRLECAPAAPGGVNDVQVTGSSGTSETGMLFQWNERFLGI